MESKILTSNCDINAKGCSMILNLVENETICISTLLCRWLNVKIGDCFISEEQRNLNILLDKIIETNRDPNFPTINAKIVLFRNPKKNDNSAIIKFLKAGASIRYFECKDTLRSIITGNQLYIVNNAIAEEINHIASYGFYYKNKIDDPFIDHYKKRFNYQFDRGKKVILKANGKIGFEISVIKHLVRSFQDISIKDILLVLCGASAGLILTILFT